MSSNWSEVVTCEAGWWQYLHAANSATIASDGGDVGVGFSGARESRQRFESGEGGHHVGLSRGSTVDCSHGGGGDHGGSHFRLLGFANTTTALWVMAPAYPILYIILWALLSSLTGLTFASKGWGSRGLGLEAFGPLDDTRGWHENFDGHISELDGCLIVMAPLSECRHVSTPH